MPNHNARGLIQCARVRYGDHREGEEGKLRRNALSLPELDRLKNLETQTSARTLRYTAQNHAGEVLAS